jgi:two-component system, LuxR family, response regulator FixJ
MRNTSVKNVFFVDDEPKVRHAVAIILKRLPCQVSCFANGPDCLKALCLQDCDLLITDVNMPGMDGLELLNEAKRLRPLLPVLVVTGYGDIPLAVRAMKTGALDFIEKPLKFNTFIPFVESALKQGSRVDPLVGQKLTRMEMKILQLIIDEKTNKEIAHLLHRGLRTIESHRNRLMRKLHVHNVAGLIKRTADLGLVITTTAPGKS